MQRVRHAKTVVFCIDVLIRLNNDNNIIIHPCIDDTYILTHVAAVWNLSHVLWHHDDVVNEIHSIHTENILCRQTKYMYIHVICNHKIINCETWMRCLLYTLWTGECCGSFQQTYGAKYGKGSQLCGTYMYNEIVAAGMAIMLSISTH